MDASLLDRQITLSHRTTTQNAQGEKVPTFTPYAVGVWAQKIEASARDAQSAGLIVAQRTVRFRIRWRSDVIASDNVTYEGTSFYVHSVIEMGRHDGLEIMCTANVP